MRTPVRTVLIGAAVAALLAVGGCAGAAPAPTASPPAAAAPAAPAATGVQEFVGPVGDGAFYVAFALKPGGAVEAYVCDGTGQAENFTGNVVGDRIQLTSADGDSTLTATSAPDRVTGTLVRAGATREFSVPKVNRAGGLYDLDAVVDGGTVRLTGTSRGGNVVTSEIRGATATGTIALVSGGTAPLDPMAGRTPPELNDFQAYRVLIADDGTRRGNPKPGARKTTTGGSYTCPYLID
ncbi:hypothetical protein H7X46_09095 [Pseudonocardia sp. C8]|uniref:hypothetical protein n=1 Tax=Pseudonocardia sp. C8 TaxID=2762759 RepID=UPI0016436362|nr:hypothetical protein [Pseudonocardia sp. C8]MBC3191214.1 hypothetical protein [Pseudonocardia sp. C8]